MMKKTGRLNRLVQQRRVHSYYLRYQVHELDPTVQTPGLNKFWEGCGGFPSFYMTCFEMWENSASCWLVRLRWQILHADEFWLPYGVLRNESKHSLCKMPVPSKPQEKARSAEGGNTGESGQLQVSNDELDLDDWISSAHDREFFVNTNGLHKFWTGYGDFPSLYYVRQHEALVWEVVEPLLSDDRKQRIVLVGSPGVGKSCFLTVVGSIWPKSTGHTSRDVENAVAFFNGHGSYEQFVNVFTADLQALTKRFQGALVLLDRDNEIAVNSAANGLLSYHLLATSSNYSAKQDNLGGAKICWCMQCVRSGLSTLNVKLFLLRRSAQEHYCFSGGSMRALCMKRGPFQSQIEVECNAVLHTHASQHTGSFEGTQRKDHTDKLSRHYIMESWSAGPYGIRHQHFGKLLWTLAYTCAEALNADFQNTAYELLLRHAVRKAHAKKTRVGLKVPEGSYFKQIEICAPRIQCAGENEVECYECVEKLQPRTYWQPACPFFPFIDAVVAKDKTRSRLEPVVDVIRLKPDSISNCCHHCPKLEQRQSVGRAHFEREVRELTAPVAARDLLMELRQRLRGASAAAAASAFNFGKKVADDPSKVSFWICEGLKKRHVRIQKNDCLEVAFHELKMENEVTKEDVHFMNESTGIEGDVVRVCSREELEKLLEKFACRDVSLDEGMMAPPTKPNTPIGQAIFKIKQMSNSNPTIKMLQKTFEDLHSPHAEEAELLERFPEIDPIFETDDVVELPSDSPEALAQKCDMCDVSWPDEQGTTMYKFKKLGIVTHKGCAQFTADVLYSHPGITTREAFVGSANPSRVNRPGVFHVTVHRAVELRGAQLLGTQTPYAKLSLLPWKEPMQTKPSENGGKSPLWKSMHDNVMQFSHMYNSTITPIPLLEVEVWNSNYLADDLIACTLLDMTPLLRYPNIEAKRWFVLSSRVQTPMTLMGGNNNRQPKIQLSIKFVPLEGKYTSGNEHRFRVHQLKSIGLAIPHCSACDRVIVNVLKGDWGSRCEYCGIDVHKGCIMKAMSKCECKRTSQDPRLSISEDASSKEADASTPPPASGSSPKVKELNGLFYKVLNSVESSSPTVGELFVNFHGLHLCTKQCQPEKKFHAKNIFEGDTYCRITIGDVVYETSPVLKSADPMCMEKICVNIKQRNATFCVEVIDFNTDTCLGELKITLFQLLQRKADAFVKTNPYMTQVREPLQRILHFNIDDETQIPPLTDADRLAITSTSAKAGAPKKRIGYVVMDMEYVEDQANLLHYQVDEDISLLQREEKEWTVDNLKQTIDRFSRLIKTFKWLDAEYSNIISWKNKKKSGICLAIFVIACIKVNLEYLGAYVMLMVLLHMLYMLHLRINGSFVKRWIGYIEYEAEQADQLKLHRPLADLYVAVHEARLSEKTDKMLMDSQSVLKDIASSKWTLYVRMKFIPNDKKRSDLGGDTIFIPSVFDETIIGWTQPVEKSRHPIWRRTTLTNPPSSSSHGAPPFLPRIKKDFPYRNFNISWRHNALVCECDRCTTFRENLPANGRGDVSYDDTSDETCGIDHHAYYYPIPQAFRKNYAGRQDLAPWRCFPGLINFELCLSWSGEAKETPDLVIASGSVPMKSARPKDDSTAEMYVKLVPTATSSKASTTPVVSPAITPASTGGSLTSADQSTDNDVLLVRLEFRIPDGRGGGSGRQPSGRDLKPSKSDAQCMPVNKRTISRAERNLSEYVCETMVEREKPGGNALGAQLFDAFWKVKGTMQNIQNEIGRVCGAVACVENLLNWAHPWKTGLVFSAVFVGMIVFAIIPGRWIVLLAGLSEFTAVFMEDLPPSNHARNLVLNFLSSIPTDLDLIDAYSAEREVYMEKQEAKKEAEEAEFSRLRHHALWTGIVQSKSDGDRSYKNYFMVVRPFRFVLWKNAEDAEQGSIPQVQLLFDRMESIVTKIDDKSSVFHVFGTTASGTEEKRTFSFDAPDKMTDLLDVVRQSCHFSANA
ncbi:TPA: hypothetical protein N0F65_012668 [Lagenidium giganteum]|uniref:Phorbol-ester/DAG-type domain-containing protein n=1 Tax=Lagenidium giganteum TaxID=4803 RepID=A0AAV2YIB3_9STRA|nr:TPA: hypothetical protein N0F65_012668 [Lagenidium giganteum]